MPGVIAGRLLRDSYPVMNTKVYTWWFQKACFIEVVIEDLPTVDWCRVNFFGKIASCPDKLTLHDWEVYQKTRMVKNSLKFRHREASLCLASLPTDCIVTIALSWIHDNSQMVICLPPGSAWMIAYTFVADYVIAPCPFFMAKSKTSVCSWW